MLIDKIEINNFRCFEHLEVAWHPRLNVIVGTNGSGKTALLKALRIGAGAFFTGITDSEVKKINIDDEDIRRVFFERNVEKTDYTSVICTGSIQDKALVWERSKGGKVGTRTNRKDANDIKSIAESMQAQLGSSQTILPIIAYYPTSRLFGERKYTGATPYGSRLRGYYNSLDESSDWKFLTKWFVDLEFARFQDATQGIPKLFYASDVAKKAVLACLPDADSFYYNPEIKQMAVKFKNNRITPFDFLSDGAKNLMLLAADIALKCILLNPAMELNALNTPGVVLIDEVDLHLHPKWQRVITTILQKSFPKIQFFITTHSPQVLSSTPGENVYILKDYKIVSGNIFTEGRDSNSILQDVFEVPEMESSAHDEINRIYELIDEGSVLEAKNKLQVLITKRGESDREVKRIETYLELV
ncbi:AAA family ATPase [Runella sp.]|uniref:AAA family ATPase n=1 Tax=Runella sp. TaxID=1960881 RepID=UPI0030191AD6